MNENPDIKVPAKHTGVRLAADWLPVVFGTACLLLPEWITFTVLGLLLFSAVFLICHVPTIILVIALIALERVLGGPMFFFGMPVLFVLSTVAGLWINEGFGSVRRTFKAAGKAGLYNIVVLLLGYSIGILPNLVLFAVTHRQLYVTLKRLFKHFFVFFFVSGLLAIVGFLCLIVSLPEAAEAERWFYWSALGLYTLLYLICLKRHERIEQKILVRIERTARLFTASAPVRALRERTGITSFSLMEELVRDQNMFFETIYGAMAAVLAVTGVLCVPLLTGIILYALFNLLQMVTG